MVKVMTQEKEHSTKTQTREDRLRIYQKPMVAGRKLIYVCSPLSPNSEDPDEADQEVLENLLRAKRACELLVRIGALPVCPHLYLPYFLDDEIEEERGLAEELALAALRRCHEVWVFSENISSGMVREIAEAAKRGIPVRMICESNGFLRDAFKDDYDDEEDRGEEDGDE